MNFNRLEETARALLPNRGSLRCFHVAQINEGNRIVSIGFNQEKSHPKIKELGYWNESGRHAELEAILKGSRSDYTGCVLSVLRIDRNQKINSSRPCPFCLKLIDQLNFKRVYFTNSQGKWDQL